MNVAYHRRIHRLIVAFDQFVVDEVFQLAADDRPLGQPKNQPGTHGRVDHEKFQLPPQHAVIAAFGFLDFANVFIEFLAAEPGRAVNPLQLLTRGVALPIRTGHGKEFESPNCPGTGNVRSPA